MTPGAQGATRTPDGFYALIVGCYVAAAVAPPAAAYAARASGGDVGLVYGVLLAAAVATVAVVGHVAYRVPGLAVRLGSRSRFAPLAARTGRGSSRWSNRARSGWWFGAVPVGYLVALAVAGWVSASGLVVALVTLGAVAGGVFGLGLAVMSENRRVRAATADAAEHATFDARLPKRVRDLSRLGGGVAVFIGAVGLALGAYVGDEAVRVVGQTLVPLGAVAVAQASAERTFEVTDAGLVLRRPVNARLLAWEAFDGYDLTPDALVLRRGSRLRFDVRCDRGDLDDPEAVAAALGRFVPVETA